MLELPVIELDCEPLTHGVELVVALFFEPVDQLEPAPGAEVGGSAQGDSGLFEQERPRMHELPRLEVFHGGDDAKSALTLGATHGADPGCLRSEETDKRRMERIHGSGYENANRCWILDAEADHEGVIKSKCFGRLTTRAAAVKGLEYFLGGASGRLFAL